MRKSIEIRKAVEGYIAIDDHYLEKEHVFTSLEKAMEYLLLVFEGRAPSFSFDSYGKVIIERKPEKFRQLEVEEFRQLEKEDCMCWNY